MKAAHPQLLYEAKLMKYISGEGSSRASGMLVGIPNILWYGTEGEYNIMAMELLGPSLEDLLNYCGRKFSLKTALMVGSQLVSTQCITNGVDFAHRIRPRAPFHPPGYQARQFPHRAGRSFVHDIRD